jgi:hypothetical protein
MGVGRPSSEAESGVIMPNAADTASFAAIAHRSTLSLGTRTPLSLLVGPASDGIGATPAQCSGVVRRAAGMQCKFVCAGKLGEYGDRS